MARRTTGESRGRGANQRGWGIRGGRTEHQKLPGGHGEEEQGEAPDSGAES